MFRNHNLEESDPGSQELSGNWCTRKLVRDNKKCSSGTKESEKHRLPKHESNSLDSHTFVAQSRSSFTLLRMQATITASMKVLRSDNYQISSQKDALWYGSLIYKAWLEEIIIESIHSSIRCSVHTYWKAHKHATLHNFARHATSFVKLRKDNSSPTLSTREETGSRSKSSKSSQDATKSTLLMATEAKNSSSSLSRGRRKKRGSHSMRQKENKETLLTVALVT